MTQYFSPKVFTTVFLTIALFVLGIFVYGLFGNVNIQIGSPLERTFTVTGEGTVEVTPDTYTSTFTVQEEGSTQEEAQQAGNTKQNEALSALNDLGFAEEDIQTTQYSVNPRYDFPESGREQSGFEFYQSTTIETKEREKMEQALDSLGSIGINISGIQVEADEEQYLQEARTKAVEDARKKAQELADAGDFQVGGIVSIAEQGNQNRLPFEARESLALDEAAGTQPSVISPGTDEVSATVAVTYFIK